MNLLADENISFEEAMSFTQSLLDNLENLDEVAKEKAIASLVKTPNGARGFFVTDLTNDFSLADNPSQAVINGLKSCPEIVAEFLVKNVAMSTAMAITHQRNKDEEMAKNSQRVTKRCLNLIRELKLDIIAEKFKELKATILKGEGKYQDFLQRWSYDDEQKQAIIYSFTSVF